MTTGQPVTLYGDGSQTRDFVYIDDVVRANIKAMDARVELIGGCAFNIGSGVSHSILQTAQTLAGITGFRGSFIHAAEREGEVKHSLADIRQARHLLGFAPATSFQRGLTKTLAWMRSSPAATHLDTPLSLPIQPAMGVMQTVTTTPAHSR